MRVLMDCEKIIVTGAYDVGDGSDSAMNADYCGSDNSGWAPDSTFGVYQGGACLTHDQCYAAASEAKSQCDTNFLNDMLANCAGNFLCAVAAYGYYAAVVLFGDTSYGGYTAGPSPQYEGIN